ncbi:hypothetical protein MKW92_020525 [Papaver armeniacum]|nr:hypothetical protein MKW92_020525 [Papaver armeniacum]
MVLINQVTGESRREDRISELPDPLINFILSFLPTKCVVSMSVLSKRWRCIWTSVPVIDLRELEFPTIVEQENTVEEAGRVRELYLLQYQRIMDWIDRKLSLHHETRDIKQFYLDSRDRSYYESSRVEEWISALITRHNLEEFAFYADGSPVTGLFPSSGGFASLTILEVDTFNPVYLPNAINFPKLKICRLWNTDLYLHSEDLTQQFFSNLPVLEELELMDCQWNSIMPELFISAPALKYLLISGPNAGQYFDDTDDSPPSYEFKVNIFAPNLQSLRYTDVPAEDYILHRFESLVDAEIDLHRFDMPFDMQEKDPIAAKVLEKLSNVKLLKISGKTFEALSFPDNLFTNWPVFHNLVLLEVTSKISFVKDKTFLNFLRITPNLETIVIAKGFVGYLSCTDSGSAPVPQCMLSHLKSVKFCEFAGFLEELNTVRSFLKNARVLGKMIIKFRSNLSTDKQNKITKQLVKFPIGSSSCVIEVS